MRCLLGVCIVVSCSAFAKDPFEDFHKWGDLTQDPNHQERSDEFFYGDVELGFIVTTGNTNSSSTKFKANLYQDLDKWRNQAKFDSLLKRDTSADQNNKITAARTYISLQGNYRLGEKNSSLFLFGDYEYDRFSGVENQATFVSGYGNRLFKGRKDKVDFDIGPGVNYQQSAQKETELGYVMRVALQWERTVSERTRFNQNFSAEQSLSGLNSRLKSETALVSQINGALSLKFSYLYRYNTEPEVNKSRFDAETSATFVYRF